MYYTIDYTIVYYILYNTLQIFTSGSNYHRMSATSDNFNRIINTFSQITQGLVL